MAGDGKFLGRPGTASYTHDCVTGADDSITALNRGCTAHEHIDKMNIVHMNGRIYDPRLGRFMQADTLIEADATQGLNRYTYVLNNPLTHTDPSGHSIAKYWRQIAAIAISIAAPYAATAVWGTLSGTASFWVSVGTGFLSGAVASGDLKGGLWGAFSAGLFYGIGTGIPGSAGKEGVFGTNLNSVEFVSKVALHGIAGGVVQKLQGGKFGHGFASAGITQAFSGKIDTLDAGNRHFSPIRVVAAAMVGGSASAASGGKFANGAVTGAFSRAFNEEWQHDSDEPIDPLTDRELRAYIRRAGASITPDQLREALGAAKWAVSKYRAESPNWEYAGVVYLSESGRVIATAGIRGESEHSSAPYKALALVPAGGVVILDYHTHTLAREGWSSSFFSPEDVVGINEWGRADVALPSYVGGVVGTDGGTFFIGAGWLSNENARLPNIISHQRELP